MNVWQEILVVLNTVDTAAGVLFLLGSWFGFRAWWRLMILAGWDVLFDMSNLRSELRDGEDESKD